MRIFISMFMVVALVMTTSFPSMSYAMMPHEDAKAAQTTQTEAAKSHDCHGHNEAKADSQETAQNDKDASGKCCDKGMCKCVGGTCHNGLSKIFGNSGNSLATVSTSSLVFAFDNQFVASALPNRLKRPPRA